MALPNVRLRSLTIALLCACLAGAGARASGDAVEAGGVVNHRFALLGHAGAKLEDEKRFKRTLDALDGHDTSFLVVTGVKDGKEPCTDKLYQKRRELMDGAHRPVIVVVAGGDWTGCTNSAGGSDGIERLTRLREVLYGDPAALGKGELTLTRQSSSPRFRSYMENAHWSVGKVLYATLNLPANNNHYLTEAGRNSEYEDRMVANRYWLNRLFAIARRDKYGAVVLFADGDLKALTQPVGGLRGLLARAVPDETLPNGVRDGFAATRRQVVSLAQKFTGKVLLVDDAPLARGVKPAIEWRANLGHLSTDGRPLEVEVDPSSKALFAVRAAAETDAR